MAVLYQFQISNTRQIKVIWVRQNILVILSSLGHQNNDIVLQSPFMTEKLGDSIETTSISMFRYFQGYMV
ncbi:hypothetical protein AQUCO_00400093v1 [Aquilegia coerulea]|uniref:Uncharacterized protein n=1 Tax=Aquilegia coerulea TaxID=218851 RepID=A0A2G5ETH1_AQUCA|nr:hypothetical protein AQUCO_00400093v1 [Aquilegia coerulea]